MERPAQLPSLTVREADEDDRAAIRDVVTRAFGRDDETKLVERLWADDAAALEIVGLVDGEVAGYCGFSLISVDPPIERRGLGMAPVAVLPAHQKKGVGAAMIETGIETAKTRGAALIVVLGEPGYYARFGFEPASKISMRWAETDAGDAFQAICSPIPGDGAARLVHYHPAFSAFT